MYVVYYVLGSSAMNTGSVGDLRFDTAVCIRKRHIEGQREKER